MGGQRFLSRGLSGRGVARAAAWLVGAVGAVLLVGFAWNYADVRWLAPRRSDRILQTLDEGSQSLDQQLAVIDRAISENPRNDYAWYMRARKLTEQKRYADAAPLWARLEGKLPGGLSDLYRADLGVCLLYSGHPVESLSCFQEALHRRPDHVSSRVFMAAAYVELGMPDRARDEIRLLDRLRPDWRKWFAGVPEWPDARKSALRSIAPYLSTTTQPES
jgi:tetratricopeptide (TPR) repeat protein